jgi:hypothetical protein
MFIKYKKKILEIYLLEYYILYAITRMGDKVKKDLVLLICGIVFVAMIFSGCQGTQVENKYAAIFESDVVNLLNYTIIPNMDNQGNTVEVNVEGLISNILDRRINVILTAEFYDETGNYIAEDSYRIIGLLEKPRNGHSTTFSINYDGENVEKIDNVKLRAEEII